MSLLDKYKAVIFDWDGTIVDTCGLILDSHNHVRQKYGQPLWTQDDFLNTDGPRSTREYYPEIFKEDSDQAIIDLYDYIETHHLNYLEPLEGAFNLLDAFDVPIGLVSNKRHSTLMKEVIHLGVEEKFSCIVGAGQAERDKPAADPLLMGIELLPIDVSLDEVLFVGDTQTDLLCAKNAGVDVVFLQNDRARPDLIEKYAPKLHFMSTNGFYLFVEEQKEQKTSKIA